MEESNKSSLEKIASAFHYVIEAGLYVPFDLVQVPIRDRIIPRAFKRIFLGLSCRRYFVFGMDPSCSPARKYQHDSLFEKVCSYYDPKTGLCTKKLS